jgi:hypothetical protein
VVNGKLGRTLRAAMACLENYSIIFMEGMIQPENHWPRIKLGIFEIYFLSIFFNIRKFALYEVQNSKIISQIAE